MLTACAPPAHVTPMTTATIPAPTADDALASLRAILCGDGEARHRASPCGHPPAPAASGSSPPPAWQKITISLETVLIDENTGVTGEFN